MVHSIKIFWKNMKILGFLNSVKMTFTSIIKLNIYILFWAFGKTKKLIARRSEALKHMELDYHHDVIYKISNMDHLHQLNK